MSISVDDLKTALADYEDLLTFEHVGDIIKVQLTQFLHGDQGKAKWEAINSQIKQFGGEWVSLGKNSHWKVKASTPQPTESSELREIVDELERVLTRLRKVAY